MTVMQKNPERVFDYLRAHFEILGLIIAGFLVLFVVTILITAFITAANVRVYTDGYRAAVANATTPAPPPREAYRVFVFRSWLAAGRARWTRVAMVYMITALFALGVMAVVALLMAAVSWAPPAGCVVIPLLVLVLIPAVVALAMWSQKATVIAVVYPEAPIGTVVSVAWQAARDLFALHLAVTVAMFFLGIVASFIPLIGKAVGSCWASAAFVTLTEPA